MEAFVKRLIAKSDLRVLTKGMIRDAYKKHTSRDFLEKTEKKQLSNIINSVLEDLQQQAIASQKESKADHQNWDEDGKENNFQAKNVEKTSELGNDENKIQQSSGKSKSKKGKLPNDEEGSESKEDKPSPKKISFTGKEVERIHEENRTPQKRQSPIKSSPLRKKSPRKKGGTPNKISERETVEENKLETHSPSKVKLKNSKIEKKESFKDQPPKSESSSSDSPRGSCKLRVEEVLDAVMNSDDGDFGNLTETDSSDEEDNMNDSPCKVENSKPVYKRYQVEEDDEDTWKPFTPVKDVKPFRGRIESSSEESDKNSFCEKSNNKNDKNRTKMSKKQVKKSPNNEKGTKNNKTSKKRSLVISSDDEMESSDDDLDYGSSASKRKKLTLSVEKPMKQKTSFSGKKVAGKVRSKKKSSQSNTESSDEEFHSDMELEKGKKKRVSKSNLKKKQKSGLTTNAKKVQDVSDESSECEEETVSLASVRKKLTEKAEAQHSDDSGSDGDNTTTKGRERTPVTKKGKPTPDKKTPIKATEAKDDDSGSESDSPVKKLSRSKKSKVVDSGSDGSSDEEVQQTIAKQKTLVKKKTLSKASDSESESSEDESLDPTEIEKQGTNQNSDIDSDSSSSVDDRTSDEDKPDIGNKAEKSRSKAKRKTDGTKRKPGTKSGSGVRKRVPHLSMLRKICFAAGIVLHYDSELQRCNTDKQKIKRIKEILLEKGMKGNPSMRKVEKLRLKKEAAELDTGNIISKEGGRPKRKTRSLYSRNSPSPVKTFTPPRAKFDRLKDIIDSEDSD